MNQLFENILGLSFEIVLGIFENCNIQDGELLEQNGERVVMKDRQQEGSFGKYMFSQIFNGNVLGLY